MTGRATPRRLRFRANGAGVPDGTASTATAQHSYEQRGCRSRNRCYPEQGPGARTRGWQWWIARLQSCHASEGKTLACSCSCFALALDESESHPSSTCCCVSPSRTRLRSARAGIEALGDGVCEPDMTCHCRGYQQGAMANCRWAARKIRRDSLLPALRR